jgi:hypothetical protein
MIIVDVGFGEKHRKSVAEFPDKFEIGKSAFQLQKMEGKENAKLG